MKTLNKEQEQRRESLADKFDKEYEILLDLISKVNEMINDKLNGQVATVNGILTEMREFHEEITDGQQEYYDERSEKWQESDAGSDYQQWMSEWQGGPPPDDIEEYELLEEPGLDDTSEELKDLPSAVDN